MVKRSLTPEIPPPNVSAPEVSTSEVSTHEISPPEAPAPEFLLELQYIFRYLLLLFVSSRIALTLVGLSARAFVENGYGKQFHWSKYDWLDLWGVWDSFWYMDIAKNGYSTLSVIPGNPDQTNFPFFPLYPLLMKLLGELTGGEYFLAGLFISNACLLLSGYLLYRLVEQDFSRKMARRSLKYLFLFPVAFILSGVFTESLYLCLTLLCFYLAKGQRWWLAGIAGLFLSATRPLGVLIVLPLAFEYWQSHGFRLKRIRSNSLFLLLVPLGLLAFAMYNYRVTGDFLYFKTNQAAWGREIFDPVTALWTALQQGLAEADAKRLLEVSFAVAALLLLMVFYKTIGFSYWLLGMYSVLIPLAAGVSSLPRFTLPIFPLFIVLAKISQDDLWDDALTVFLGLLQGALMVYWCTGQPLVV